MKFGINAFLVLAATAAAINAMAEPSGDRPDDRHAWAVHDVNRPDPVAVVAKPGQPPSDAVVLFDGTAESIAKNWCDSQGNPTKWTVKDGLFVCVPRSGPAVTREKFADCQLHVEWLSPVGDDDGLGNSGVILMGVYEIQILNSYGIVPSKSPWKAANYADGQAGAVYGQNPPMVNPARPAGEWQSFDIVFHPPVWNGDTLVDPGSATVFFNGVLVQDAWPFEAGTTWCRRLKRVKHAAEAPLYLQDHGNPVPFRNVWIRRIPSRYANTVCGGPGVKAEDVAALRTKLAEETKVTGDGAEDVAEKVVQYWSSYAYRADPAVKAKAEFYTAEYVRRYQQNDKSVRHHVGEMKRFVNMLANSGFIAKDAPVVKMLNGQ
ncbi:MAG: DUF1080 domain-containing protein [Kiritimatiellae bacterium]|nr:DUF1080 domain-containing protein [Kiritimatiellia bacterium]